jgi:hypothetical protein
MLYLPFEQRHIANHQPHHPLSLPVRRALIMPQPRHITSQPQHRLPLGRAWDVTCAARKRAKPGQNSTKSGENKALHQTDPFSPTGC